MGDWGLAISEEGYDVKDCATKNLVFSSNANTFKIYVEGTVSFTLTAGAGSANATITHNLGYIPWALTYANIQGKNYNASYFQTTQPDFPAGARLYLWTYSTTTTTKVNVAGGPFGSDYTFTVYYYIAVDNSGL